MAGIVAEPGFNAPTLQSGSPKKEETPQLQRHEAAVIFEALDFDGDGCITHTEFVLGLRNNPKMAEVLNVPTRALQVIVPGPLRLALFCAPALVARLGRVTSGGPVTVTVTEPIPCYRSREGLFYVCLASGNQRRSCYRSRGTSLCYRSLKKTTPSLDATSNLM